MFWEVWLKHPSICPSPIHMTGIPLSKCLLQIIGRQRLYFQAPISQHTGFQQSPQEPSQGQYNLLSSTHWPITKPPQTRANRH